MNPNSCNQLWSLWTFNVFEGGRHVPRVDVEANVSRWLREGFGSAGVFQVRQTSFGWAVQMKVEGAPAHDPGYMRSVARQFQQHFIEKGFGPMAFGTVRARVLAGSLQDGSPALQWIELPKEVS